MSGSQTSAGSKVRLQPSSERELLDAIRATDPVLYVNVANRPMIEIPFEAAPEAREAWPLDSDRVEAEVALFAYSRFTDATAGRIRTDDLKVMSLDLGVSQPVSSKMHSPSVQCTHGRVPSSIRSSNSRSEGSQVIKPS